MMESLQQAFQSFLDYDAMGVGIIVTVLTLNNLFMAFWCSRFQKKTVTQLEETHLSERARATETINALRGIIYAFSTAQDQQDEERRDDQEFFKPGRSI